jgi:hypothetical protein
MTPIQEQLSQLEKLNFTGKGEAFVESRFITPLLQCLRQTSVSCVLMRA